MKSIILLGALVISAGTFAQVRSGAVKAEKQIESKQTEIKQETEKVQQEAKDKVEQKKEQVSKIDRSSKEAGNGKNETKEIVGNGKDKVNNGNAYGKDKQGMTGKEFGQSRAAEAKVKAATVKTKADADAVIRMSKEDTKESVKSIDDKMVTARQTLMDQLASKKITQAQFDEKLKKLMEFEKRKSAIVKELE